MLPTSCKKSSSLCKAEEKEGKRSGINECKEQKSRDLRRTYLARRLQAKLILNIFLVWVIEDLERVHYRLHEERERNRKSRKERKKEKKKKKKMKNEKGHQGAHLMAACDQSERTA
jgi:hypothetical protein